MRVGNYSERDYFRKILFFNFIRFDFLFLFFQRKEKRPLVKKDPNSQEAQKFVKKFIFFVLRPKEAKNDIFLTKQNLKLKSICFIKAIVTSQRHDVTTSRRHDVTAFLKFPTRHKSLTASHFKAKGFHC